ncbi:MAG: 50S ribosomal protein L6 [Clostridia bacterium]|nr:50S ribosomal protein L6 [Clostridia bacterium]
MSRIGKKPVELPGTVSVTVDENNLVTVQGPKGTLTEKISSRMKVSIENGVLTVERPSDVAEDRALHGLSRTLIANMVEGVTKGFSKTLDIVGVGYRAQMQGTKLVLNMGYSHPVEIEQPEGIKFETPSQTRIVISGASKHMVGETAAKVRKVRGPEPYKGKGIKYENEVIRRKAGKTGK